MYRISLEESLDLILQYSKDKDQDTLERLLANFDDLLVYYIKRYKTKNPYLKGIDEADIYQTSVVALCIAIDHIAVVKVNPCKIPAVIRGYVRNELRKLSRYLAYEMELDSDIAVAVLQERKDYAKLSEAVKSRLCMEIDSKDIINYIFKVVPLTKYEKFVVVERFKKGRKYVDIANDRGVTPQAIMMKVSVIIKKTQKKLNVKT